MTRRNKFGAKRVTVDGKNFHSQGEAARYCELELLRKAGKITELKTQVKFPLHSPNEDKIGDYIADFTYFERGGNHVVEDFKGVETDLFKWKRKHLESEYGIELRVTRARK
jgi:hypothetical protein